MGILFSDRTQRILFSITVLISIFFLCYPKYLPMVDLPQHVALVVSFDDLLKGRSVWDSMLWINWHTPYIGSYLYWLLWYQILPILWATKVVIISIFLLYLYAIRLLRKTFQADRMLDWVGLTCFFGFSFQFGFVSYMAGIAFGLLFLALNKRYLDNPNKKDWWLILLTGVLTYFNHLLAFAFFCMTAYAYFIFSSLKPFSWQQRIKFTVPYVLFALLLLYYLTTPDPVPSTFWEKYETAWSNDKNFSLSLLKIKKSELFLLPWNVEPVSGFLKSGLHWLYLLPLFMLGLTKKKSYYVIFLCALTVYFIMPMALKESFYLYHRLAWIVPIFYFLLWQPLNRQSEKIAEIKLQGYRFNIARLASMYFIVVIFFLMCRVYVNQINFAHSSSMKDMEIITQQMQPEKKVLYLYGRYNPHNENVFPNNFYDHLALYYQAFKQGWVDKNFASEHAIPVRLTKEANYTMDFRDHTQIYPGVLSQTILRYRLDCTPYDYLIVRSSFNRKLNYLFKHNPKCANMRVIVETKSLILLGK